MPQARWPMLLLLILQITFITSQALIEERTCSNVSFPDLPELHLSWVICKPGFVTKRCSTGPVRCNGEVCYGVCHMIGSYERCICQEGRGGASCHKSAHKCKDQSVCLNGGVCILDDDDNNMNRGECLCPIHFTGKLCEISVASGLCNNTVCGTGTCIQHKPDVFGCKCNPGSYGVYCEKNK
ncbi:hypothetical protein M513_07611, partial [Trichuris suis]